MRADLGVSRRAEEDFAHWNQVEPKSEDNELTIVCLTAVLALGYGHAWLYFTAHTDNLRTTLLRIK